MSHGRLRSAVATLLFAACSVLALRFGPTRERAERTAAWDAEMNAITGDIGQLDLPPRGRALWHEVVAARALRERERRGVVAAVEEGDPDRVSRAYVRWELATGRASALVADLSVFNLRRLEHAIADLERIRSRSVALLVAVLGASAAVALAFSLFVNRYLGRVEQVLANAAQHAPGARVVLRGRAEAECAILSVEDEGRGIPEAARERVFEPYEKVDRVQRGGPGLGLGLHIAREIVEAHGGRIRATAGRAGGAKIVVELPAAAARDEAAKPLSGAAPAP